MPTLDHIRDRLRDLVARMDAARAAQGDLLHRIPHGRRASAENLINYLCLREEDLTELQEALSSFGLSSLGRCEGAVYEHCQRVLEAAIALGDRAVSSASRGSLLHNNRLEDAAQVILGPGPSRVMVTLDPSDANVERIAVLLRAGMRIARINAGHGEAQTWQSLISSVRQAARSTELPCRIMLDMPGPKVRIGVLPELPGIFEMKSKRDRLGVRTASAVAKLCFGPGDGLPLEGISQSDLEHADRLRLRDARGRRRELKILLRDGQWLVEHDTTLRIVEGAAVNLRRKGRRIADGRVFGIPSEPLQVEVAKGDALLLVARHAANAGTRVGKSGAWRIPCTWDDVFLSVEVGHRVSFDDGRCEGTIVSRGKRWLRIEFHSVSGGKTKLRSDQSINFPDTNLPTPDLLDDDRRIIEAFSGKVDILGCSFVQGPENIRAVRACLGEHAHRVGLVAKIETLGGCQRLSDILLEGLHGGPFAVMVARGDLAVEIGFSHLAEVQEEILWLCEAAHVPVIWGTQVLEKLAKKGIPTRAEVTDAAMSSRAECVMLNKGPYVEDAIRFLHEVVPRIRDHLTKKRALLRHLPTALTPAATVRPEPPVTLQGP